MNTRILCLKIKEPPCSIKTVGEACLQLSPFIFIRDPETLFVDITKSLTALGGEAGVWQKCGDLLKKLSIESSTRRAIHSTPALAEILAHSEGGSFRQSVLFLPVEFLEHAQGLHNFDSGERNKVLGLIKTLERLGLRTLSEFLSLPSLEVTQSWGDFGYLLKQKILGTFEEVIGVFEPDPLFVEQLILDFEIHNLENLSEFLRTILLRLEVRLMGRGCDAHRMKLEFQHLYHKEHSHFEASASHPTFDTELWLKMFKQKIESHAQQKENLITTARARANMKDFFSNPIGQIKIEAFASPRKSLQLHLWNDTENQVEALSPLVNFLSSTFGDKNVGFVQLLNSHNPGKDWMLSGTPQSTDILPQTYETAYHEQRPIYLPVGPRPTQLLEHPQVIDRESFKSLQFLTPIAERIEDGWWSESDKVDRDYYVVRKNNELLWIFYDRGSKGFYVHGYF